MSGPKLSEYELERMRKEELMRVQREIIRLRALAIKDIGEATEGQTWCKKELGKLEQQRGYLNSSTLSGSEKKEKDKLINDRIKLINKLKNLYSSQKKNIEGSELDKIRSEQQHISSHAEKCRNERAAYEEGRAQYKASVASVAENLAAAFHVESYSYEQAIAEIRARQNKTNDGPREEESNLKETKNDLLLRAESILDHPFAGQEDKERAKNAMLRVERSEDPKELDRLRSWVIREIELELEKRFELNEKYLQVVSTYNAIVLALGSGEQIAPVKCFDSDEMKRRIDEISNESKKLEERLMRRAEQEEIARCIDDAMEELGYNTIGEKRSGKGDSHTKLYEFSEGAGLQIMQQNGAIRIQVVGLADEPKTPNDEEKQDLLDEQKAFCEKYDRIIDSLEKKGVIMLAGTQKRLPPSEQFSQYVDVRDYNPDYAVREQESKEPRTKKKPKVLSKA